MRASEIEPKKLVIFDIDDTLVYTQTKVHVIKDGEVVKSLNSHDFTHYKLDDGESFDFGDFSNAKEFFDNSKPNIPMMNQLKQDINTGNKVVMVTARSDFDDKELFLDTFRKFGVNMSKVHVYRAGNIKGGTTEQRKKQIIKMLLDKDIYSKAIMYDDAKPNLHTFMELKKDHPRTRFYAWHVSLDGKASEYMRENMHEGQFRSKDIEEFKPSNDALNDLKSKHLPDWEMLDHRILQAKYVAQDHREAEAFVRIINKLSEKMDHFCEVTQDVAEVTVKTTTFDVKGLTILDFQIAMVIDKFANDVGIKQVRMSGNFGMHENFADGKKPGRKGLAKRSGVNTKASVSSLRKTAKNSSGEKQRMAHWMANMKAGKKK